LCNFGYFNDIRVSIDELYGIKMYRENILLTFMGFRESFVVDIIINAVLVNQAKCLDLLIIDNFSVFNGMIDFQVCNMLKKLVSNSLIFTFEINKNYIDKLLEAVYDENIGKSKLEIKQ